MLILPSWNLGCRELLESRGLKFTLLKSTLNAENFTRRLPWSISSHFGAINFSNAWHRLKSQKIHYNPVFWGARLFKVINVSTSEKLISSASSKSTPICNCFQARRVNYRYGKIMTFYGYRNLSLMSLFERNPFTLHLQNFAHKKLKTVRGAVKKFWASTY